MYRVTLNAVPLSVLTLFFFITFHVIIEITIRDSFSWCWPFRRTQIQVQYASIKPAIASDSENILSLSRFLFCCLQFYSAWERSCFVSDFIEALSTTRTTPLITHTDEVTHVEPNLLLLALVAKDKASHKQWINSRISFSLFRYQRMKITFWITFFVLFLKQTRIRGAISSTTKIWNKTVIFFLLFFFWVEEKKIRKQRICHIRGCQWDEIVSIG